MARLAGMSRPENSLNTLKKRYETCRAYIDYVQAGCWMAGRKDVSDFWAKFFKSRQNYPGFNEILCLRRGFTYPLADRGGSDINFEKERLHAEAAFWNM